MSFLPLFLSPFIKAFNRLLPIKTLPLQWLKASLLFLIGSIFTSSILSACTKVPPNMLTKKVPQTNIISVSLAANKQYKLGQTIPVTFILANGTPDPIRFLKWGTPFENRFWRNQFDVNHQGKNLSYQGRMLKRGKPTAKDYILINPMESLQTTVDIKKAYPLNDSGQYTVTYRSSYLNLKATDRLTKVKASNTVTFTLNP